VTRRWKTWSSLGADSKLVASHAVQDISIRFVLLVTLYWSLLTKFQYNVTIAPEMNYAIMAALTTVLDDLRTDEGC